MSKIIQGLKKFFNQSQMSGLEAYIVSHKPQNAADVDRLSREYTQQFVWGRGLWKLSNNFLLIFMKLLKRFSLLAPKLFLKDNIGYD